MKDLGKQSDVVVVGGVACGPKTAATLARRMPDLKITLFQKERELSYGSCGMPYFASGDIPSFSELLMTSYGVPRDADFFRATKGFEAITEAEVVAIDRLNKKVTVRIANDQVVEHGYDKLVLATGARPQAVPFEIPHSDRVRTFTRPDDARAFRKMAETGQVGSAVIVGGGFIGCELAEAMVSLWGIETTLIELEPHVLPYVLDSEMAALVEVEMRNQGVTLRLGNRVDRISLSDTDSPVVHLGDEAIEADFVFLCLGVSPNVTLAQDAGLKIGVTGGIVVNLQMQTSDPDIYAGGDCVQSTNRITDKPALLPMGSLANRHGRVIAENIAGNETDFPGVLGAFLVKVFDLNVGAVGLSEGAARAADLNSGAVWGSFADRAEYYPEAEYFSTKITFVEDSLRLLGLQAVGKGDICRRIDVFSSFLARKADVDDLLDFEHGYAPPYSEALDPLHHLAAVAIARQKGIRFVSPDCGVLHTFVAEKGDLVTWLDVREAAEVEAAPWKSDGRVVNIPLGELRARISELDPDHRIIIVCRRGPRSYQAALMLQQAGFDDVHVVSGGTTMAMSAGSNG
ncbi:MAG: FAD-dependent oxidoreductase [bacterium]